jgi:dolichol-phosphate mannosyltransferase
MMNEKKNNNEPDLSIILPTYNESLTIEKMLDAIVTAVPPRINTEVLVIDDDSPDGTSKIVNSYIQKSDGVVSFRVHTRKGKRGLSSAVIDGINLARGKFVLVMDSDFSHPPQIISTMYDELVNNGLDIVVGSRYVEGGKYVKWPLTRKLISKVGNGLAGLWLGLDVKDSMTGLFALKKDLIKNLSFEAIGYKILLEILVKTKGAKVKEVPFVCVNRKEGSSKFSFSIINDYFKLLKILRKTASYNKKNR